jgi:hypothetical protein
MLWFRHRTVGGRGECQVLDGIGPVEHHGENETQRRNREVDDRPPHVALGQVQLEKPHMSSIHGTRRYAISGGCLFRFDARELDHLGPLLGVCGDQLAEVAG